MTKEVLSAIQDAVGTQVFGIWFLIGAAFVFFMQAGFAMVEAGFTRAKNAGNIIMKNLMDFCIGTCDLSHWDLEFCLVKMHLADLSELRHLEFLPIMQILTGPILYLTWCSVRQRQPSYPEQWQNVPNSYLIVFIPQ